MFKNRKYLIAVSGGPDSMALLSMYQNKIDTVIHVNYHYRNDSDNDMNLVKKYCHEHKLNFICHEVEPSIYQSTKNFENTARIIRYEFFSKIAKKRQVKDILIAHHLDDFMETCLMQESRKVQTTFYGIKEKNYIYGLNVIRPLINKRKKELVDYCLKHSIPYVIDSTNCDSTFTRNKFRKEIEKWSDEEFNTKLNYFINKNKKLSQLDWAVKNAFDNWMQSKWSIPFFNRLDEQIKIHVLYMYLIKIVPLRLSIKKIQGIIQYLKVNRSKNYYRIGNGYHLLKINKKLHLLKK